MTGLEARSKSVAIARSLVTMWTCGTTAGFPGARVRLASPVLRTETSCLQTNGHTHLARVRVANGPSNGPERVRHPRAAVAGQGGIIGRSSRHHGARGPDRRTGRPVPHGRRVRTPGVRRRCRSHMPERASPIGNTVLALDACITCHSRGLAKRFVRKGLRASGRNSPLRSHRPVALAGTGAMVRRGRRGDAREVSSRSGFPSRRREMCSDGRQGQAHGAQVLVPVIGQLHPHDEHRAMRANRRIVRIAVRSQRSRTSHTR